MSNVDSQLFREALEFKKQQHKDEMEISAKFLNVSKDLGYLALAVIIIVIIIIIYLLCIMHYPVNAQTKKENLEPYPFPSLLANSIYRSDAAFDNLGH